MLGAMRSAARLGHTGLLFSFSPELHKIAWLDS